MGNSIFRKASLDRVSSPEQLNDYIKVTRPSVWLIFVAVLFLLISALVWGIFGNLQTTQEIVIITKDGSSTAYYPSTTHKSIESGMDVEVGDWIGKVSAISTSPVQISHDFDAYTLHKKGWKVGDWVSTVSIEIDLPDGIYEGRIITETIAPITFVLN